ncbi:MAG: NAD-dependent epimerase/dehydratase family protein [Candidatus Nitrosotenuis sp.]
MKIFVTGGAGFIGKHLVRSLLEKGHTVTVFDNFSNSKNDGLLAGLGAKIIEGDITEKNDLTDAAINHDVIVHLAAKISVEESIRNPSETFLINVDGTKNVLDTCKKNNIKKIVVASSAAVYGEGLPGISLTEDAETNPVSPYGESKKCMEEEIRNFALKNNITYSILRFFNIFGIGQTQEYAGVITKFVKKIIENKPLEIFGDGTQTRDFVAVQDVVDAIHNAIMDGKNKTYNIASGRTTTVNELAQFMISLSGKNLEITHVDAKRGDIKYSQADISLAKKEIHYSPRYGLEEIRNLLR